MGKNKDNNAIQTSLRAPVVTIMGHVDHGKTTLLDYIRNANVAEREHGGITQHVSSYQVVFQDKPITFIDTPGHEAFFAMRERGAKITDIVILVVAADDGVMPQTKEVIGLWKKMNVQLIVAINKIDMPGADIEKVKRQLSSEGVLVEGYGGDIPFVEVSAKNGTNIDKLLELINLVAELKELDKKVDISNADFISESIVLESYQDKSLGSIANVIIKSGEVKRGHFAVGGQVYGKIRTVINDLGKNLDLAVESQPVKIVGIPSVLEVGEIIRTYDSESKAREVSKQDSFNDQREAQMESFSKASLASFFNEQEQENELKVLNLIIVTDTKGSLEAIENSLKKIDVPGVELKFITLKTGLITQNDLDLAKQRNAIILTFNIKTDQKFLKLAEDQEILLREYKIIYEMFEEIEAAMIGLVAPTSEEEVIGEANVLQIFRLSEGKFVTGCRVTKGKILKGYQVYVLRRNEKVHEAKISSLRNNKNEVKEVGVGMDCGILMEPNIELQTGDKVICYKLVKSIL
jgi:translation initiation factor IF-2